MLSSNVLFVIGSHRWTGAAQPAVYLARALADRGATVAVASAGGGLAEAVEARRLPHHTVLHPAGTMGSGLRGAWGLRRLLDELQPDIVHAVETSAHWMTGLVGKRTGNGRILVAHNFRQKPLRHDLVHRWLYGGRFDGLVDLALEILEEDCRQLHVSRDHILHLAGAVDVSRFQLDNARQQLCAGCGIDPGKLLIGVVARMQPKRRHDCVIRAMSRARTQLPDFQFVLVGKGELRPALQQDIADAGLADVTTWAYDHDVPFEACLAGLDLSIYPAEGADGTARTVLECMAARVPVIAAPRPVLRELILHGKSGLLADPDNDVELADAILRLAHNRDLRTKLADEACANVTANYTYASAAERLLLFYERLRSWNDA